MDKSIAIWKLIADDLVQDIPVMLLYVLESSGSSPGRQGFFMAVDETGRMEGSIGGGIMEHKLVELAREKLRASRDELREGIVKKQIHDKTAATNQSGMICSGEQTVLIYPVKKNEKKEIDQLIKCLEQNKPGTLQLSPDKLGFSAGHKGNDFEYEMKSESDWHYTQRIGYSNHLHIIGGGHCALALSHLMSRMDFYLHLYEDRADLHTMTLNNDVHEKKIVSSYAELSGLVEPGDNQYVVIMTFGYRTDGLALRALLGKNFKYLGLLGSRKKIDKMFEELAHEGVGEDVLRKIHAPVGIAIKSETPEEIAVSIAAEIVREKNVIGETFK